jgi:hypothetical protein
MFFVMIANGYESTLYDGHHHPHHDHDHDQKEFANKNGEKENGLIKTNKKSQNTSGKSSSHRMNQWERFFLRVTTF